MGTVAADAPRGYRTPAAERRIQDAAGWDGVAQEQANHELAEAAVATELADLNARVSAVEKLLREVEGAVRLRRTG